jgi:hypothetical protein
MIAELSLTLARPRLWLRLAAIMLGGAALGLVLLVMVDSLVSMPRIAARLAEAGASGALGDDKAEHRAFGFVISRFSECIGLSVAASGVEGEPQFSLRSRAVLWQPGTNICDTALAAVSDRSAAGWFDYARYWHGYRVLVFPLVEVLGVNGAGLVLAAATVVASASFFLALLPVAGAGFTLLGFAVTLLLTGLPFTAVTPTHAVSLALLFLAATLVWRLGLVGSLERRILAAAAAGMAYNYVDFFYHPGALAMLVGGLAVIDAAARRSPLPPAASIAALLSLCVLGGYLGFWALKWLFDLPLWLWGSADFPVLSGDFGRWSAGRAVPLAATLRLVQVTVDEPIRLLVAILALAAILAAAARSVDVRRTLAALLVPIAIGVLAVEAASSHSLAHATFTFRIVSLALVLLALGAGAALRTGPRRTGAAAWPRAGASPGRSGAAPPAPLPADWRSAAHPED